MRSVFAPAYPLLQIKLASGADIGDVVGTRNGTRGDRELLFLGPAANHAAKIISSGNRVRLAQRLYDALPSGLQELCTLVDDELYQVQMPDQDDLDELLADYNIAWDRTKSADRVEDDMDRFPLANIEYGSANTLIDLDDLSIFNNKSVVAASVFADVAGFTKYIDSATTYLEQESALRVFHAIRREMARVVKNDFGALRVQF